jgi:uncharacterized membrane protein YgcG
MQHLRRVLTAAVLVLVLGPGVLRAEKSLHWRALDVAARLDADGKLHVVEHHVMMFTGDWNGGERTFRLFPGQALAFSGIRRVDGATGAARELTQGDLSQLDHYDFTNATTLRWRSRLPADPPFEKTELVYEIGYTLSGVLLKQGDTYRLDHNFALPDARQTIESFSVALDFDPVWTAPQGFASRRTAGPLAPGADFLVQADLARAGGSPPSAVRTGTPRILRAALFGILLLGVGLMGSVFYLREASLGRFGAPVAPDAIDAIWLEKNVFSLPPEQAGALWDDTVGAPEVTAVLARLTAEKKLESEASGKELTMRLMAPLDSFEGFEKELLSALFFDNRKETSTAAIKAHYKKTGFDPAATIRDGLLQKLAAHSDFQDRSGRPARWPTFLLFLSGVALLALEPARGAVEWGSVVGIAISHAFWWAIGLTAALFYQRRMEHLGRWSVSFLFVPLLFLWSAFRGVASGGISPLPTVLGLLLLELAIVNNLFNAAKTREGPKKIARRRQLVAARRYFERELSRPSPRMKDAWFPWVAAFGLGPAVDRWSHSFGGAAATASTVSGSSVSTSSGGSSVSGDSGGFTGGGGFSGGGGSSGSWAVAAGALAAGVSAPSSSGGGGGGGGGGSSGGGGGGGW